MHNQGGHDEAVRAVKLVRAPRHVLVTLYERREPFQL